MRLLQEHGWTLDHSMFLDYLKTIKINHKATRGERDRYKKNQFVLRWKDPKNLGNLSVHEVFKDAVKSRATMIHQQGRGNAFIPPSQKSRQRPIDEQLRSQVQHDFIAVEHRCRRHRQRHGGIRNNWKNRINGKKDMIGKDGRNGTNGCRFLESPSHFANFSVSQSFCLDISRTDISECRARDSGVKTRNTSQTQHTHIFSRCAPCSTVVSFVHLSFNEHALAQVSRVLKTLSLLHSHSSISCLVATSGACFRVVLLVLTDWRRNRGSTASIPPAVAGLVEWLNSRRSHSVLDEVGLLIPKGCGFPFRVQSFRLLLGLCPSCVPPGGEN